MEKKRESQPPFWLPPLFVVLGWLFSRSMIQAFVPVGALLEPRASVAFLFVNLLLAIPLACFLPAVIPSWFMGLGLAFVESLIWFALSQQMGGTVW